jgi:hypothetical protein
MVVQIVFNLICLRNRDIIIGKVNKLLEQNKNNFLKS